MLVASQVKLAADASEHGKPWYESIARCGHLNLNERDPLALDCEAWMDYFASLKVDTVLHNGGGIMAFYPTERAVSSAEQVPGDAGCVGRVG